MRRHIGYRFIVYNGNIGRDKIFNVDSIFFIYFFLFIFQIIRDVEKKSKKKFGMAKSINSQPPIWLQSYKIEDTIRGSLPSHSRRCVRKMKNIDSFASNVE